MTGGRYGDTPKYWLRIDLLDINSRQFGYKDGAEEMGMCTQNKPSAALKKLILQYIPTPEGYGLEWRKENGVPYVDAKQPQLAL